MVNSYNVSSLGANAAVSFLGGAQLDGAGGSVAGGSDVNGDGFNDIVIGARSVGDNAGAVYVVFGSANGFTDIADLSALGAGGLTLTASANDGLGFAVALPGDVNNDGIDDILVSTGGTGGGIGNGEAYLIFGGNNLPTTLDIGSLGGNGLTMTGLPGNSATAVSGAGDFDNDGVADFLVAGQYNSATFVVYGDGALGADIDLTAGPSFNGLQGKGLAGGGDINGDGIDDILVGHNYGSPVIFGTGTRFGNGTDIVPIGTNGYRLTTPDSGQYLGDSVAFLGDVNGDGAEDFAVFAGRGDTPRGPDNGGAFIMYGGASVSGDVPIASIGNAGFIIHDAFLGNIASAGDFNGDGIDDILFAYDNGNQVYVIFGRNGGFGGDIDLRDLADDEAVLFIGPLGQTQAGVPSDVFGSSMAPLGDVNGDGFDDILVGAPGSPSNPGGGAYIIFGFSNAPQTLAGGGDADTLTGGGGNDTISGGGGHDLLIAGGGDDQITGDDGD
ncbi:MAG: FG-GAP-like repeat-containing protein, partial [Alphaproteobacteria bacterium]